MSAARSLPTDSPALQKQSEHYPIYFDGRVPLRVRMLDTVSSELPFGPQNVAYSGGEFECWVNSHGAVAVFIDGELLGVKPDEFKVLEWHQTPGATE